MDKTNYKEFLSIEKIDVASRVSKANKIEKQFKVNLDKIVSDDHLTYSLLKLLSLNDHHGNNQNTVRKYYIFKNGRKFPDLKQFERGFR